MIQLSRIGWGPVLPMVLVLSACGGGSGGGGNDQPEEQTGPQLSYDRNDLASKAVAITSSGGMESFQALRGDLQLTQHLLYEINAFSESMPVTNAGTYPCEGGGTVEFRWQETETTLEKTTSFNQCSFNTMTFGDVVLSGSTRYESALVGETATSASWKSSITDDLSGSIKFSGELFRFSGVIRMSDYLTESGGVTSWRYIRDVKTYERKLGSRYVAIADAQNRDSGTDADWEYEVRGTIVGSAIGGYVQLETLDPLEMSENVDGPISGIVKLSSNGESEVRFGSSAGGTAKAAAVWIDGAVVESYEDWHEIGVVVYF
ncbi:hypothetical protein [Marinobacter nauticus]|uniref:hypothetical protein n=1 Tax=Marinobacter nauticus TaxID=2743 RepID=UPI000F1D8A8C|nr:hypothetical protein [Marinobacter nauticus]RKR79229.1 hypothetical protein C7436_0667 [Marinobacter nauticus]